MPAYREFSVSIMAERQAERIGFSGDVKDRVKRLAKRSVKFSHRHGNARCGNFLLTIENEAVVAIFQFDPETGKLLTS